MDLWVLLAFPGNYACVRPIFNKEHTPPTIENSISVNTTIFAVRPGIFSRGFVGGRELKVYRTKHHLR